VATRLLISMKMVRVGAARFVMTTILPLFSTTNNRFVSPGGEARQTGLVKFSVGKAFDEL